MKEKIDKLVNEVRKNFSIINKTLKEMEESFVFKGFEDNLPTVEQYSDGYSIYLLDENETELPVEYAAVIMDKIGYILQNVLNQLSVAKLCEENIKKKTY